MRRQLRAILFVCAAASLVGACASTHPTRSTATASASVDIPGYVRVASNGQELFCQQETPTGRHIKQVICFTQAQLMERERDLEWWRVSTPAASVGGVVSMYTYSPSGR